MNFFAAPGLRFETAASAASGPAFPASTPSPSVSSDDARNSSPGLFTEEDEENERRSTTLEDLTGSRADLYGTVLVRDRAAEEVLEALSQMDEAMRHLPLSRRRRYDEAREKCPDQVTAEKKVAFLWRMDFDAKLAAERLAEYWEFKHSIFGDEKCFLPLTLSGALGDDVGTISAGIFQLVPVKDSSGRAIVFFEPSRRRFDTHSTESVLRAFWYVYHVALEDPDVKKRGVVWLAYVQKSTPKHFDINLYSKIMDLEKRYIPILTRAFHICHPDPFFRAISPIARHLLGQRLRKRSGVHYGTEIEVLDKLVDFGIPPSRVPTDMGGGLVMDTSKWLCDRLSLEEKREVAAKEESDRRKKSNKETKQDAVMLAAAAALQAYQQSQKEGEERHVKRRTHVEDKACSDSTGHLPNPQSLHALVLNEQGRNKPHSSPPLLVAADSGVVVSSTCSIPLSSVIQNNTTMPSSTALYHALLQQRKLQLRPHEETCFSLGQNEARTLSNINNSTLSVPSGELFSRIFMAKEGNKDSCRERSLPPLGLASSTHGTLAMTSPAVACASTVQGTVLRAMATEDAVLQKSLPAGYQAAGINTLGETRPSNHILASISSSSGIPLLQNPTTLLSPLPGNTQILNILQHPGQQERVVPSTPLVGMQSPLTVSRVLFIPLDEDKISSHQCLIRKQIEAFTATEDHVKNHARGRNKPIALGQVGIRCRHCKGLPLQSSQRGSIYFPATLVHLYQAAVNMAGFHFTNSETCCSSMPADIREEFQQSKPSKSTVGGGKKYWANAGKAIGIVETPSGMRLTR